MKLDALLYLNLVGQAVCLYAGAGLRDGESVILIMTADHREPIRRRLRAEGLDPDEYERMGRLVCLNTEDLLAQLVTDGVKVRLFGEMVSQLRSTSLAATTRIEELWNEIINAHSVPLLCTYVLDHPGDNIPQGLVDLHSHNFRLENAQPVG
jgi:hypothetical protein